MRLLWSKTVAAPFRGLALARERGWVLTWDGAHSLSLWDHSGEIQAQQAASAALVAACCADDGSTYAATGYAGQLWLLGPDLRLRWERSLPRRGQAMALDPFGQYLALAEEGGLLHLFNARGRVLWSVATPRPLQYLAFIPEKRLLVGSADFGLVAWFDLAGHCLWRDGLVAHVGSLATTADGSSVILACFSDGLRCYRGDRPQQRPAPPVGPCRLAALSYTGDVLLTAGLDQRVVLRQADGTERSAFAVEEAPVGLALGALGERAVVLLPGTMLNLAAC